LAVSRQYEAEHHHFDWATLPFAEFKIPPSFAQGHMPLLNMIAHTIVASMRENPQTVDSDVIASLQALAEMYRTLTTGIYYEKPPDYRLQRELYAKLVAALQKYKKVEAQQTGVSSTRDSEVRDALIFFTQLGAMRNNGRLKGRAFIDLLRRQVGIEDVSSTNSNLLIVP
jgi:hypothetical protein